MKGSLKLQVRGAGDIAQLDRLDSTIELAHMLGERPGPLLRCDGVR
jgi:hypothetical protein